MTRQFVQPRRLSSLLVCYCLRFRAPSHDGYPISTFGQVIPMEATLAAASME